MAKTVPWIKGSSVCGNPCSLAIFSLKIMLDCMIGLTWILGICVKFVLISIGDILEKLGLTFKHLKVNVSTWS